MRFKKNNATPTATGIMMKIIVLVSIGNTNSDVGALIYSVISSPIGTLSIFAVFDKDAELNPFPETIAEIVT